MATDTPQGPGWWQANDGKWYPPVAPSRKKKNALKGIAIAVGVGLLIVLGIGHLKSLIATASDPYASMTVGQWMNLDENDQSNAVLGELQHDGFNQYGGGSANVANYASYLYSLYTANEDQETLHTDASRVGLNDIGGRMHPGLSWLGERRTDGSTRAIAARAL
jgi:hypothetical protein